MEVFLLASVDLGWAKSLKMQSTLVEMRYYVFSQTFISQKPHALKDLFRDFFVYY